MRTLYTGCKREDIQAEQQNINSQKRSATGAGTTNTRHGRARKNYIRMLRYDAQKWLWTTPGCVVLPTFNLFRKQQSEAKGNNCAKKPGSFIYSLLTPDLDQGVPRPRHSLQRPLGAPTQNIQSEKTEKQVSSQSFTPVTYSKQRVL